METIMDKSWINLPRLDPKYLQGVINFLKFACKNILDGQTEIACPCKKCHNMARVKIDLVKEHLVVNGFTPSYTYWIFHGEKLQHTDCGVEDSRRGNLNRQDEMQEMVRDAFGIPPVQTPDIDTDPPLDDGHNMDEETTKFFNHQTPVKSSIKNDRRFLKMKSKIRKMKRFLEALGYTDDSDDDSDDEFNERPKENLPDASSAHRQASPEDIDQQPQPHSEPIAGVPADGIVRASRSAIDESSFMRGPLPVTKAHMVRSGEKQVEANRNACETTRVTKKRRISQSGSN